MTLATAFHSNYDHPYLAPFQSYSEILVENRRLLLTQPVFGARVGVTPLEFRADL